MKLKESYGIEEIIGIQKKIVPEIIDKLVERYNILRIIHYHQPIGRRNLSNVMGIGERIIRGEVNVLKEQGFIDIRAEGMNTTELGENSLEILRSFIHEFKGLDSIEEEIRKKLNIKKVLIVPGFKKEEDFVLREVGRVTSLYLKSIIKENMVIGITGGQTMAMVAEEMSEEPIKATNITVVPARGGLGKNVEKQSNTIAANLAKKLKGVYKLLHMPDNISKDLLNSLSADPNIKEVIDTIQKIEILAFGIGRADKMAKRRGLQGEMIDGLLKQGAVAEAFGYYFNKEGKLIHEMNTVGVSFENYKRLRDVIGAAVGEEKAEAIIAISRLNENLVLVMDESLARGILNNNIV